MSKKTSKNRNTNKALKALKRKRAKVFVGGGGFSNIDQSSWYKEHQKKQKAKAEKAEPYSQDLSPDEIGVIGPKNNRLKRENVHDTGNYQHMGLNLNERETTGSLLGSYKGLDGKEYSTASEVIAANAKWRADQVTSGSQEDLNSDGVPDSVEVIAEPVQGEDPVVAPTTTPVEDAIKTQDDIVASLNTNTYEAPKAPIMGPPDDITPFQTQADLLQKMDRDNLPKATAGESRVGISTPASTGTVTEGKDADPLIASSYTSEDAKATDPTEAAQGDVSKEPTATDAELSERVKTPLRDTKEEEAAMDIKAAERPDQRDYADGVTSDEEYVIQNPNDPEVKKRVGQVITEQEIAELRKIAPGREIPVDEIMQRFPDIAKRVAQTGAFASRKAQELGRAPTERAAEATYQEMQDVGVGRKEAIDPLGEAGVATREGITGQAVEAPDASRMDTQQAGVLDRDTFVTEDISDATAKITNLEELPTFQKVGQRVAATGEAAQRIATELGDAPSVDLEGREAILGEKARGNAASIDGVPTLAASKMQAVTGEERKMAAADMAEVVAELPPEITAAVSEDPATVEAQIDSGADPKVNAAVAAMPQEALVSVQMETLLSGMEEGKTPAWARPAVAQIEQMMAQRGLSASTVGRDALFNAIIQSALPMAQSNAQALQQRAQQNLSNEQQANLQGSQQTMQIRMQNLANTQTAASQTAQMAQDMAVQQGTFRQQAVMTEAQQGQETRMMTAQMGQQRAQQESAQLQQAAVQNLNASQQIELANLQALNQAGIQNLSAEQQSKLTEYQAVINRNVRQAEFQQEMERVNLSSDIQVELSNLREKNLAASETMTAENQERLTRLNTLVDFKKTNAGMAQQMELSNLSNDQQMRMAELSERATTDAANFSTANQMELARLQTYTKFMSENTQILQQTELANFSMEEKFALADLASKNQASSENLSAEQQVELANLDARLKESTLEAQMRQQVITQDFSQKQQMELANLEALNRADADSMSAEQQSKLATYNAQVSRKIRQTELNQDMERANLDVRLKSELAELSEKNATDRANMSSDQQMRLANLSTLVDFKKTDAAMAQQMDMANMGNEQQLEMAQLAERASTDAANMTAENSRRLSDLQTFASVMSQNEQLAQQADLANLSMEEKIRLVNLSEENKADAESMSAENVAELQKFEKKMGAAQVNANLAQQMGLANLSNEQQASMFNAQIDANMDMKQFDANQQMQLANSQFMKSMTMKNLDNKQQGAMQNATALASMDIANADARTRVSVENAKNFLAMDMSNLSNSQQAVVLDQQMLQQRYLSDAAATNASRQFNATSQQQLDQYMTGLAQQMQQFNSTQNNAMQQFNATEKNRLTAIRENNQMEVSRLNAQLASQVSQFNAQMEYNAEQWNASNAQAVEQSNITWRRNANTSATAAQNAANQQTAGFEFNMDAAAQASMWQQLREEAGRTFGKEMANDDRIITVVQSALSNEAFMTSENGVIRGQRQELFQLLRRVTSGVDSVLGSPPAGVDNDGDGVPDDIAARDRAPV